LAEAIKAVSKLVAIAGNQRISSGAEAFLATLKEEAESDEEAKE